LKTVIPNDTALQFDIEEDLDILDLKQIKNNEINNNLTKTNDDSSSNNDTIRHYKNKLKQSESKVEELVEIVAKLRLIASDLLTKQPKLRKITANSSDSSNSDSDDEKEDSAYFKSYSNYSIHLEMLQVTVSNH
jgi:hypothetical protein